MMSKREFRHPQVMGQIMLLSRVASHELSTASALLVGRLTLLEGGCSLMSSMRSSLLVWDTPIGVGGPLVGFIVCHSPPRGRITEALWLGMSVVVS